MTTWWGKIIGAICGALLMGPIGFILGLFIGHFFDKNFSAAYSRFGFNPQQHAQSQQVFFRTSFLVMGHIAKADGHVSEAEIQAARTIMQRMGLNEAQKQQAIAYFQQGKQADFDLNVALTELVQACHQNKVLLRMFLEIQLQAALADGGLTPSKQRVLQTICQHLGFAPVNFNFFEDLFNFQRNHQQYQYSNQHSYRQPPRNKLRLEDAYELLGVTANASDAEIKRAYRRQMSQHHPDKLVAKGLPEEMIKLATEKTQNIKAAYEQICAARGIS